MPKTVRLRPGNGGKDSAITWMLHPSALIRDKRPKIWKRERVEGLVLVGNNFWVVRRGSSETDEFIMLH